MNNKLTSEITKRFEIIYSMIPKEPIKIADLGCSEFGLHDYLKNKLNKEIKLVGIDFYEEGKNKYSGERSLKKADLYQDFNNNEWNIGKDYNLIIAGEIIEHLDNPKQFLINCYKCLKKGGKLILTTPNGAGLHNSLHMDYDYSKPYGHIVAFTEETLRRLLAYAKFQTLNVEYSNYRNYFLLSLINKRLGGSNIIILASKGYFA